MTESYEVAVFARAPETGKVKTRLAEEIGASAAAACYRILLRNTINAAKSFRSAVWVRGHISSPDWLQGLPWFKQPEGDLGERMYSVLSSDVSILVGCDCPLMSAEYIERAQGALTEHDVVFGPVEDGGYCLVGMKKAHQEIFRDMTWSNAAVLSESVARTNKLGLSHALLDTLWDVDDAEDYRRWLESYRRIR